MSPNPRDRDEEEPEDLADVADLTDEDQPEASEAEGAEPSPNRDEEGTEPSEGSPPSTRDERGPRPEPEALTELEDLDELEEVDPSSEEEQASGAGGDDAPAGQPDQPPTPGDEEDAAGGSGEGEPADTKTVEGAAAEPVAMPRTPMEIVEDAIEASIDDPETAERLRSAMEDEVARAGPDPDIESLALSVMQTELDDPDVAEAFYEAVETEVEAERLAQEQREAEAEAIEDAEMEEVALKEAEIEDATVDEDEIDELDDADLEEVDTSVADATDVAAFQEPGASAKKASLEEAPQRTDRETRELLDEMSEEHERRIESQLAQAKELEQQAKELETKAEEESKLRKEFRQHSEHVTDLAPELGLDPDRPICEIPEIDDPDIQEVEFSTIEEGFSHIRILYNEATSRYLYEVIEPDLNELEEEVFEFLRDTLVRTMDGRRDDDQDWEEYLEEEIERAILDHSILIDGVGKRRLQYYIKRDFLGYGPIDVIMHDPMIEDISCDGPGIPIYIFHRQYESTRTNVIFEDESELDSFVIKLAQRSGKHISVAEPMLDATLPDTSRLQATLSREVTTRGSSFTIRKFRADPLTAPDLIRLGTLSSRMAAYLWIAMEDESPMLMAGGTASGKTTTLNAMAQFIPPEKKVVSIEDTREINLIHENWIAGLTRAGFAGKDSEGSINMYQLLESALRQRPEYLLVGEVRGEEASTLFQAMATGHATYSTLHADSVRSAVHRLENPPIDVPRMMLQTLDAIAVQTQARVDSRMVRRIKELTEIVGIDSRTGDLLTNQVYQWDPTEDEYEYLGRSHILERRMEEFNLEAEEVEEDWRNRAAVMDWMVENGIRHIEDVSNVLAAYYADPDKVLERVKAAMDVEAVAELAPEDEPAEEAQLGA